MARIETADLILRSGNAEDGEALYENLWSRPEVFRFLFSKPSPNLEAGKKKTAAYAQMHKEVSTEFFVCEKISGAPMGIAGIKELTPGNWTITDIALGPAFQGKGYGKQILTALMNLAFGEHGAKQLFYDCFAENAASKALALSCGFSYSHSAEGELEKDGQTVILDYYKDIYSFD